MPEEMKGLSWFRLITLQVIVGTLLIGICAYVFRIPVDEVHSVSSQQNNRDRYSGVPMRVDITYPGLGTISIDDPKELLKLKDSFSELLSSGQQLKQKKSPRLLITGTMSYLDQPDIPFQIETNAFWFGHEHVNSLNVSADIRKLQSTLIDKMLTPGTIGEAVKDANNSVFALNQGEMTPLSRVERNQLTAQLQTAARVIDFSSFEDGTQQPNAHFVVQLTEASGKKHWLHLDSFNSAYIVVFDLLDETNQRAYFKLNDAS